MCDFDHRGMYSHIDVLMHIWCRWHKLLRNSILCKQTHAISKNTNILSLEEIKIFNCF